MPRKHKGANNTRRKFTRKPMALVYADSSMDQLYGRVETAVGNCHFKIITISYENFVKNPENEISRICKFLKTKKTKYTKKVVKKENFPAKINENKQIEKREFIRSKISKNLYKKIFNLTEKYEKNLYNL